MRFLILKECEKEEAQEFKFGRHSGEPLIEYSLGSPYFEERRLRGDELFFGAS
jgi:hypothetical protein